MRAGWLAASAICTAFLALWSAPAAAADEADLIIESITKPCLVGTFLRGTGGLHFQTCKDGPAGSVRITALSGEELITIRQESGDLVIGLRSLALRVPADALAQARAAPSAEAAFEYLHAATLVRGDTSAIAELARAPEYALLPELSYQLGKLGISGRAYPPSLPLHAIALRAAEQLGSEPRQPEVFYRLQLPPELAAGGFDLLQTLWPDPCAAPEGEQPGGCPASCTPFPNRERECHGMCGPGCERCWPWVCGDCCYHAFCALHDELSRVCQDSVHPVACLNVLPWYLILGGCDGPLLERFSR